MMAGHTATELVTVLIEEVSRPRALAAVLRHDLVNNPHLSPGGDAIMAAARSRLDALDHIAAERGAFLTRVLMHTASARDFALYQLGRGPAQMGQVRALLLQHGWGWPTATTDAQKALDELVAEKCVEVVQGDLYVLAARQPRAPKSVVSTSTPGEPPKDQ